MEQVSLQIKKTESNLDSFPDFLQKLYNSKPGYDTWKQIFGNKIQEKVDIFIQKYATHLEIDTEKVQDIAKAIDRDKNESISFEEYMAFIDFYSSFYNEKGSHIKQLDKFIQKLKVDEANLDKSQVIQGKILYPDGAIYEGEISGKRHGKGKLVQGSHFVYEGEFQDDMKHGFGVQTQSSCKYEGQWENNLKCGKGKQTYFDGSYYLGDFANNIPNGQGLLVSDDGSKYEGKFVDGHMVEGRIYYTNGEMYEGQVKDTKFRHGRGKVYKLLSEGNYSNNELQTTYKYLQVPDLETLLKCKNNVENLEVEIDNLEGHDGKLLANFQSLKILSIKFLNSGNPHDCKEFTLKLLEQIHPEVVNSLNELHIYIPNDQMQKIVIQDFKDIFNIVKKFSNVSILDLSLPYWGAGNEEVDGALIDQLIQTYQCFKNLTSLKLDLHQWGYQNKSLKNEQVIAILKGLDLIKSGQLKSLSLDLGRWGVDTYESYQLLTDDTFAEMGVLIKNQTNLEQLCLNLRSWAYANTLMTDTGVNALFVGISQLAKLRKLNLQLRGLAYNNNITQASLESLAANVSKLINLEDVIINLEICYNFKKMDPLKLAIQDLPKVVHFELIE